MQSDIRDRMRNAVIVYAVCLLSALLSAGAVALINGGVL